MSSDVSAHFGSRCAPAAVHVQVSVSAWFRGRAAGNPARHGCAGAALERSVTIYLNDHLAGATAGSGLAARAASENEGNEFGEALAQLAAEIAQDREELLGTMKSLGRQIDHVKLAVGRTAEKLARLKPNGRVFGYSPLSRLLELEGLAGGIRSKRALWAALEEVSGLYPALDAGRLRILAARADRQLEVVDRLQRHAARLALGSGAGRRGHWRRHRLPERGVDPGCESRESSCCTSSATSCTPRHAREGASHDGSESTDAELKAGFEQHLEETGDTSRRSSRSSRRLASRPGPSSAPRSTASRKSTTSS